VRKIAAVAVVLLAFLAAGAQAAREPTPDERAAIVAADSRPPDCLDVTISTVRAGWALIREIEAGAPPGCQWEGRSSIIHYDTIHGWWAVFYTGEDVGEVHCDEIDVPPSVGRELDVCDPEPTPGREPKLTPSPEPRQPSSRYLLTIQQARSAIWQMVRSNYYATHAWTRECSREARNEIFCRVGFFAERRCRIATATVRKTSATRARVRLTVIGRGWRIPLSTCRVQVP